MIGGLFRQLLLDRPRTLQLASDTDRRFRDEAKG
jgi:hypothetical protein